MAQNTVSRLHEISELPEVPIWLAHTIRRLLSELADYHKSKPQPFTSSLFESLTKKHQSKVDIMLHNFDRLASGAILAPEPLDAENYGILARKYDSQLITSFYHRFVHFMGEASDSLADLFLEPLSPGTGDIHSLITHLLTKIRYDTMLGNYSEAFGLLDLYSRGVSLGYKFLPADRVNSLALDLEIERARTLYCAGRFSECMAVCESFERITVGDIDARTWLDILVIAGDAYSHLGAHRKYFSILIEALRCAKEAGSDPWMAHFLELRIARFANPEESSEVIIEKSRRLWNSLGWISMTGRAPEVDAHASSDSPGFARLILTVWRDLRGRGVSVGNLVDLLERAAHTFEANLDAIHASEAWLHAAEVCLGIGDYGACHGLIARAQRLLRGKPTEWWLDIRVLQAAVLLADGETSRAIECYKTAAAIAEEKRISISDPAVQVGYSSLVADMYRSLVMLLLEKGNTDEAWLYAEQASARTLLEQVSERHDNRGEKKAPSKEDLEVLKSAVPPRTAILMPLILGNGVAVLVIRTGSAKVLRWSASREQLRDAIVDYTAALRGSDSTLALIAAKRAYEIVFMQLETSLADVDRLVWIPDHGLGGAPLDMLHDGTHYLFERFRVVEHDLSKLDSTPELDLATFANCWRQSLRFAFRL